jgi:hypothetical protein
MPYHIAVSTVEQVIKSGKIVYDKVKNKEEVCGAS